MTQMDTIDRLPIEQPLLRSLKMYGRRLGLFFAIVVGNFVVLGLSLLRDTFTHLDILVHALLVAVLVLTAHLYSRYRTVAAQQRPLWGLQPRFRQHASRESVVWSHDLARAELKPPRPLSEPVEEPFSEPVKEPLRPQTLSQRARVEIIVRMLEKRATLLARHQERVEEDVKDAGLRSQETAALETDTRSVVEALHGARNELTSLIQKWRQELERLSQSEK